MKRVLDTEVHCVLEAVIGTSDGVYLNVRNVRDERRELRGLGLNKAYVAIYDDRVITRAPSEDQVRTILEDIMLEGRADHSYTYHFDP